MSDRLAKRKKRRRAAFWVFFTVIVLVGVGAGAALVGSNSNDSSSSTGPTSSTPLTAVTGAIGPTATTSATPSRRGKNATTTTAPFALSAFPSYKVTDGVNIRSGPATTFPVLGTVEIGFEVQVLCVTTGESVNGPLGPSNKWLRVVYKDLNGYVTSQYVAVGPAINDPKVVGTCKSA